MSPCNTDLIDIAVYIAATHCISKLLWYVQNIKNHKSTQSHCYLNHTTTVLWYLNHSSPIYELHTFLSLNIAPSRIVFVHALTPRFVYCIADVAHKIDVQCVLLQQPGAFCSSSVLNMTSSELFSPKLSRLQVGGEGRGLGTSCLIDHYSMFTVLPTSHFNVCKVLYSISAFTCNIIHLWLLSCITVIPNWLSSVDNYLQPLWISSVRMCSSKHLWYHNYCYSSEGPPPTPQLYTKWT